MCGRYVITKPVSKTFDLVKSNIKVEDPDNYNAHHSKTSNYKILHKWEGFGELSVGNSSKWAKEKGFQTTNKC